MQIIEISEPGKGDTKDEVVVGIDFGTTNSLIAYSKNHKPTVIGDLLPSIIHYDDVTNDFVIGKNRGQKNSISSVKRLLAKSAQEIYSSSVLSKIVTGLPIMGLENPRIGFKDKDYSFPELAAKIFTHLKENAENELGLEVKKAVISVPAYFDNNARGAIMLAAKIAGFEVLRLISEPTAAAYAYGFNKKPEGTYMVYDLGGGTFDVSILNIQAGILQVVATGGDNLLGGDDIDYIIAEHLAKESGTEITNELILEAKEIKEKFVIASKAKTYDVIASPCNERSNLERYDEHCSHLPEIATPPAVACNDVVNLTQTTFETLITPIIDRTIKIAKDTLIDSDLSLDGIILVGGSTRIPLITKKLSHAFDIDVFSDIDPDRAIVLGAALQAESLSSNSSENSLLIDVCPLSLGIELYGGIAEKIIMRNSPIPLSITKNFTTWADNQTGMQFHIVQGEREMAKDCRSLSRFELQNIPPMKAGKAKIEVTFALDADGILSITAREATTGTMQGIEIKPSYGMSDKEIGDLLESAFLQAKIDYSTRLLVQSKLDAQILISGVTKAMDETPDILDKIEQKKLWDAINSLKKAINSDNRDKILEKIASLNQEATEFIQKHLNKGADLLIKGKHVDEV